MRKIFNILDAFKQKKGFLRNPFLCLGLVLVSFLLILVFSLDSSKNTQASLLNFDLIKHFNFQDMNNCSDNGSPFIDSVKNSFPESPDLIFIQKNSLMAVSSPSLITSQTLGSLVGESDEFWDSRREIIEHTVQGGDTLTSLAEKYNISLEAILWANDLNKNSKIKPEQNLIIPPVSGVIHYVKEKDTLNQIAKAYKGDINKIIAFNELSGENDIYIGDILIVPGGVVQSQPKQVATKSTSPSQIPVVSSYFIVPVSSPHIITQGLHWYNAIDFSHKGGGCGKPVFSAAGGEVLKVKYGWNSGAGNNISVLHPNGVVTVYYHLQTILVKPGQKVSTGEQIGTIGNTGITTGCHLHFGVSGAQNPFAR